MTDDSRRHRRPHDHEEDDFGPPLFAEGEGEESGGLSFGATDTGPLPHWTEPPTGEMPRTLATSSQSDTTDDLDVWSSFAGKAPVWRDDDATGAAHDETNEMDRVGVHGTDDLDDVTNRDDSLPLRREPSRITIGTDPTDDRSRPIPRKGRPGEPRGGGR